MRICTVNKLIIQANLFYNTIFKTPIRVTTGAPLILSAALVNSFKPAARNPFHPDKGRCSKITLSVPSQSCSASPRREVDFDWKIRDGKRWTKIGKLSNGEINSLFSFLSEKQQLQPNKLILPGETEINSTKRRRGKAEEFPFKENTVLERSSSLYPVSA